MPDGQLDRKRKSEQSEPPAKRSKLVDDDNRNARTIFITNLPLKVTEKKNVKQLHRHILSLVPTAKIESSRFRSVPFSVPTSKLPSDDPQKQGRLHDKERAASWRDKQSEESDNKYLNPNEKKKLAFIKHNFNSSDRLNAYVVFAHPVSRPQTLPPLPPILDPYEAARQAVQKCNGTVFMDRILRVDIADKSVSDIDGDPKLSIFVGSLDFESQEDDLRLFFEGVISAERGPPPHDTPGDATKPQTWVTRVRIIRDKDTQLGKGFAYVQFADRECVDEILSMDSSNLKFAKRKLRVQRCKSIPKAQPPPNETIPHGDPSLGAKLAHLSKDERKKVKSSDADRVARRLAKKKARMALAAAGVKSHGKPRGRMRKKKTL